MDELHHLVPANRKFQQHDRHLLLKRSVTKREIPLTRRPRQARQDPRRPKDSGRLFLLRSN